MTNKMTPEERESILANEKRKFDRLKVRAALVLVPLVLGFLLMRIQISNERVAGVMDSVSVKHKATGTQSRARVVLDRGDTVEVLLPVAVPFIKGGRLEMTESTSLFGSKRYTYPRLSATPKNQ